MAGDFYEIQAKVLEATPAQCRGCATANLMAWGLVEMVRADEITLETAQVTHAKHIDDNCKYGIEDVGGCFGGNRCNFGVLCKFPGPSQVQIDFLKG
jgi:hypothetical protein